MDDEIVVWQVTPHPGRKDCADYVQEDRTEMLDYVANTLFDFLARHEVHELDKGVTLTFRLVRMDKDEYDLAVAQD